MMAKKKKHPTARDIGQRIKNLRLARQLTQVQLADRAGLGQGYVSRLERGEYMPTIAMTLRLIEVLGVPLRELIPEGD